MEQFGLLTHYKRLWKGVIRMDKAMSREIQTLESEKRMDKLALKGHQWTIAQKLNSSMGQDMKDVLEGKKQVKFSLWRRIKNGFDKLLWSLTIEL